MKMFLKNLNLKQPNTARHEEVSGPMAKFDYKINDIKWIDSNGTVSSVKITVEVNASEKFKLDDCIKNYDRIEPFASLNIKNPFNVLKPGNQAGGVMEKITIPAGQGDSTQHFHLTKISHDSFTVNKNSQWTYPAKWFPPGKNIIEFTLKPQYSLGKGNQVYGGLINMIGKNHKPCMVPFFPKISVEIFFNKYDYNPVSMKFEKQTIVGAIYHKIIMIKICPMVRIHDPNPKAVDSHADSVNDEENLYFCP